MRTTMKFFISLVVVLGLHGVGQAAEPCCDADMARFSSEMARADEAAILQAVEGFAEGFIRGDLVMLTNLWDASAADQVSFIPVERELPLYGIDSVRAYYAGHLVNFVTLSGDVTDVQIQRLGSLAFVSCRYNWVTRSPYGGPATLQPTRATLVLRKQGRRWLYLHMHESITFAYQAPDVAVP
jgi:ketosteroid isomerase-like protein